MTTDDFARLAIGSHRFRHDCKQQSRSKPLQVSVRHQGIWWKCFRCGESGSLAGCHPGRTPTRAKEFHATLSQYGRELFANCRPIAGAALEYLEARQCVIPPADGDLRYHPRLRHPGGHEGQALVALATDALTREPRTLHRTWIRADGKKAAAAAGGTQKGRRSNSHVARRECHRRPGTRGRH